MENGQVMVHGWIIIGGKSYHSILGTDRVESSKESAMPHAEEVANCSFEKVSFHRKRGRDMMHLHKLFVQCTQK